MRENRPSGSEGGGPQTNAASLPLSECLNNLKQMGLAIHNFADRAKALPPAQVDATCYFFGTVFLWILPYMEQQPVYDMFDVNQPTGWCGAIAPCGGITFTNFNAAVLKDPKCRVDAYLCPSRHQKGVRNTGGDQPGDYAVTMWYLNPSDASNYDGDKNFCTNPTYHHGALVCALHDTSANWKPANFQSRTGFEMIEDGTSNTFMIGEKHIDMYGPLTAGGNTSSTRAGTPFYEGCGGFNSGYGESNINGPTRNRPIATGPTQVVYNLTMSNNTDKPGANGYPSQPMLGSWHPGVCNFLMVDGSTHSVAINIDQTTLENLTRRDDRQAVQLPK